MAMTPCTKCGNLVRPGAKFCGKCGSAVVPSTARAVPGTAENIPCPSCGNLNRAGARFCSRCRAPLNVSTPPAAYPPASPATPPPPLVSPAAPQASATNWGYILRHAAIAGILFICMLLTLSSVGVYDVMNPAPTATPLAVPTPGALATLAPISATPEVILRIDGTGRFGLTTTSGKRLTFDADGGTNNTRVQVDGTDAIFGESGGTFSTRPQMNGTGMVAAWTFREIETREEVTITAGATTRRTDTMRIQYTLTNRGARSHQVAIRVMLDTLIGDNDGVPFLLAGENTITTRAKDLRGASVPDYIQALEREDIKNPGTMVNLAMRGGDATPPDRLVLAHWPGGDAIWEYLPQQGGVGAGWAQDSSAGLYYDVKPLAPNEARTIVFYYGLGGIAAAGKLGVTVPLEVMETEKFSIIVVVMNPQDSQRVTLTLPSSIALADGDTATKNVTPAPGAAYTQVSWKLRAKSPSDAASISVRLDPEGDTASQTIRIQPCGVTRPCNTAP